ncbi:glutaredoxin [Betaproteobacteria bacterium SCN1]|jgi:glutaredoxin|nr:glutaredoxin [Betaproteobacteria bacterium SCN1]MBN8760827.1 glutathione S-transferase N-terminal domain-containing protein [Thiobacillus sp.]ODU90673.1 MAG: glutaredoxin [Thiobacillus sp. SCN 65-179]OJW35898.1 MAG: glutaredoxin [Thiobacillus sp. 65-69]
MKSLIRLFFRTLRAVLGPFLLLGNWLTRPRGMVRSIEAQAAVDARTRALALYHFPTCPFCIKVQRTLRRLSLHVELRDARSDDVHRAALVAGGGTAQVPCLLITAADGQQTWLYESDAINAWLEREFGAA